MQAITRVNTRTTCKGSCLLISLKFLFAPFAIVILTVHHTHSQMIIEDVLFTAVVKITKMQGLEGTCRFFPYRRLFCKGFQFFVETVHRMSLPNYLAVFSNDYSVGNSVYHIFFAAYASHAYGIVHSHLIGKAFYF